MQPGVRANGMAAGGARHAGLTRLRFFLIGWVVLYHLDLPLHVTEVLPWAGPVLWKGYLGVDGFFLLSGFALWLGYAGRPPTGRQGILRFLARRLAKLWPLHALSLLGLVLLVGLAAAAGIAINDPERFSGRDLLLQALMVNGWQTSYRMAWNYPSWALSVEWAGYLAFPWLLRGVLGLPRPGVPALALAMAGGLVALQAVFGTLNINVQGGLLRFACEFLLGLGLARLATEGRLRPAWLRPALLALPAGLLLGYDPLTVLGLALLVPAVWLRDGTVPARPDLLLRLGEASFGIYLCWVFVESGVVLALRVLEPGPALRVAMMPIGFAATLAVGWLAWRFVEVPAHAAILRRLLGGGARPAAEPQPSTARTSG